MKLTQSLVDMAPTRLNNFSFKLQMFYFFTLCLMMGNVEANIHLYGIRQEESYEYSSEGFAIVHEGTNTTLLLYGSGFGRESRIQFTEQPLESGQLCDDFTDPEAFYVEFDPSNPDAATVHVVLSNKGRVLYICAKSNDTSHYIHQGTLSTKTVIVEGILGEDSTFMPPPLQYLIIALLICLSGLFSGINLGMLSLDLIDLKILQSCGSKQEQKFASIIYPVRQKGNFLLCTLMLGNVLVNNTMTILLEDLTSGIVAVVGSTAALVIFGEIIPQSICSRHGLKVGAYTIWLTRLFMAITFVISFPISKILDCLLGEEIGKIYNRHKLLEMLKITDPYNDLGTDEVKIIQGALELRTKTVRDVMTPLVDCFMVDLAAVLDFKTMEEITSSGFTRIPVYEGSRSNIVDVLFVKDLVLVDPNDCMSVRNVTRFYKNTLNCSYTDTPLDKLLEMFKSGAYHMSMVKKVSKDEDKKSDVSYNEMVGIVTLEDVIEQIFKCEIVDETDLYVDKKKEQINELRHCTPNLSTFQRQRKSLASPKMMLAAYKFLQTEVEPFKLLSTNTLLILLKQEEIVSSIRYDKKNSYSEKHFIYTRDKKADFFVLILEGSVKVHLGKEDLEFETGAFSYYGAPSLTPSHLSVDHTAVTDITTTRTFFPDYNLKAVSDVVFLKITQKQYLDALDQTLNVNDQVKSTNCAFNIGYVTENDETKIASSSFRSSRF